MVLVGTQSDLRRDARVLLQLARNREAPVAAAKARDLARRHGMVTYVETSALTQTDLKEAFDQAIVCALTRKGRIVKPKGLHKKPLWRKLCCIN